MADSLKNLQRDAATMLDSLRHDWQIISDTSRPAGEREGIRLHMQWCAQELEGLWKQIAEFDA